LNSVRPFSRSAEQTGLLCSHSIEWLPIVDESGKVVGSATRGECHSGSRLLHPVVHLHVFNSKGDIYLQKRPEWKDIQPGKWDTAVGGHVDYGETPEEALHREVREELGITDFTSEFVDKYVFDSKRERELVYVNRTTYDGEIHPSTDELDGGRFWTMQEIREAMGQGVLTPNFESEFLRFFECKRPWAERKRCFGKERVMIKDATKGQAAEIARLIMMAMTDDCCLHFCGKGYGLSDFRKMMTSLVEREDSQYSYRNALVAMDEDKVVGISVSYDGGKLHQLRPAFIEAAKEYIGKDHSGMDDETQAGELYLDSLAVLPEYRRHGIASRLIRATKERADKMGLPCVGLLVDKGNPSGEALYSSVGFQYANDNMWGGHPMKHLVL